MKRDDVGSLLAMIRDYDQRIGNNETVVAAWMNALEVDMGFEWAVTMVIDYYAKQGDRAITISWLNSRWKDKKREQSMLRGLPTFTGTKIEKDRARWWMMQGIIEGVEEANKCHSRDPHIGPILRLRDEYHRNAGKLVVQRDFRAAFPTLDWAWFFEVAPEYGQRLGY
jgi:hypothetical protein